jgi:hypothetical protein
VVLTVFVGFWLLRGSVHASWMKAGGHASKKNGAAEAAPGI